MSDKPMQEHDYFELPEREFEVRTLRPGAWLELTDGRTVEVFENPRDGVWVLCQDVDVESGAVSGEMGTVLCYEMRRLLRPGSS